MPDWQERITRDTAPAIRVEHELRYAAAAPFVHASAAWCDLGCGTGLGAAAGLGATYEGCAVLVDVDEAALAEAQTAIAASTTIGITADLTNAEDLAGIRARLTEAAPDGRRCVTCFEVIEHLSSFVPLIELLVGMAREDDCTVIASVPNDAFWAIANPHHATTWGGNAVEELRGLLPADHVVAHQVALQGSALARVGQESQDVASVAVAAATGSVPTHYVLAFGPGAETLAAGPRVVQADLEEQRLWERQRDSDLRYTQDAWERLREEIDRVAEVTAYAHELERRLGERPAVEPSPAASGETPPAA